jgi:hypothetical protein
VSQVLLELVVQELARESPLAGDKDEAPDQTPIEFFAPKSLSPAESLTLFGWADHQHASFSSDRICLRERSRLACK